ncbi:NAD(P)-dependent oxidoreductase [Streptomyces sp. NPDC048172]|uniref:NAD(P)-dependent oxidoreductase n=1 Tax=Streptomyces sp. NPDC048172 TaxID=3365505 RepID=UPI00371D99A0
MHLTIFGAAGNTGIRVVAEAVSRGHQVTAVVRDPSRAAAFPPTVTVRAGDATDVDAVAALATGQDAVLSATRPAPGDEAAHTTMAKALLAGVARTGTRLLAVGGAGSLTVPGSGGVLAVDDPSFVPPAWRAIAQSCNDQWEVYRTDTEADWTYLSPPALLEPGTRTGRYRLGHDELLIDAAGRSAISMEDLAVALLDETENPRHHHRRFTVGY